MSATCVVFNDTATAEIYTLSLHDALPISAQPEAQQGPARARAVRDRAQRGRAGDPGRRAAERAGVGARHSPRHRPLRSEEHTSELQSRQYLVCRLLLEKRMNDERRAQSVD